MSNAVVAASSGDVLLIKGSFNLTNGASGIVSTKAITLMGSGTNTTIINDTRGTSATAMFAFSAAAFGANKVPRLCGIAFHNNANGTQRNGPALSFVGDSTTTTNGSFFRMDHCEFTGFPQDIIWPQNILGLFDHNYCYFDNAVAANNVHHFAFSMHDKWDGGEWGHRSFDQPIDYNGTNFMFYEDSNFSYKPINTTSPYAMFDHRYGARTVIRHNVFTNSWIEMHGNEEGQYRATRAVQIYNNHFYSNNVTSGLQNGFAFIRSGTAIVVSNTVHDPYPFTRTGIMRINRQIWSNYEMFYGADGTNSWDVNFAGGPFATGTHTGTNGATVLTDANANGGLGWTPSQWIGYTLVNTTKVQTNTFSTVFSSTAFTMTPLAPIFYPTLPMKFDTGDSYKIWKVRLAIDAPGQGLCDVITGNPPVPVGWPNQQFDTCYGWSNVINGTLSTWASAVPWALYNDVNSNYCNNIVKAGWTPYTYPHPAQTATALPPATPNTPSPADAATGVDPNAVTLGWTSLYSFYHDILFDTVNPPVTFQ